MDTKQAAIARVAGLSLIAMAILAGGAYGYGFTTIYQAAQQTTLLQFAETRTLLQLTAWGFTAVLILDIIVAWALWIYFKTVQENIARLMGGMRIVYVLFLGAAVTNLFLALHQLKDEPQNGFVLLHHLTKFQNIWSLGLIVFGIHLILLAYLMLKSSFVPRWLGGLALLAGICYFGTNSAGVLLPDYATYKASVEAVTSFPMALGELSLAIWLVVKGNKQKRLANLHDALSNPA